MDAIALREGGPGNFLGEAASRTCRRRGSKQRTQDITGRKALVMRSEWCNDESGQKGSELTTQIVLVSLGSFSSLSVALRMCNEPPPSGVAAVVVNDLSTGAIARGSPGVGAEVKAKISDAR